jgi:hypothetical protein
MKSSGPNPVFREISARCRTDLWFKAGSLWWVNQREILRSLAYCTNAQKKGRMEREMTGVISRANFERPMSELRPQKYDCFLRGDALYDVKKKSAK